MICNDDNIDTYHLSTQTVDYPMTSSNKKLFNILSEQLENNAFVMMNFEPTFGINGNHPSTLDHLYTNCPQKISNVSVKLQLP